MTSLRRFVTEFVWTLTFCLTLTGLFTLFDLAFRPLFGAPAPFKTRRKVKLLTTKYLTGTWQAVWNGTLLLNVKLHPNGYYEESFVPLSTNEFTTYVDGKTVYVGTWGVDEKGRFWTQQHRVGNDPQDETLYLFDMDPTTMRGKRVFTGNATATVEFWFVKRLSAPFGSFGTGW